MKPVWRLTPRERQIVGLVAQGLCNKEIGAALGIAEGTVKNHLHSIFDKVAVDSRFALVLQALQGRFDPQEKEAESDGGPRASL